MSIAVARLYDPGRIWFAEDGVFAVYYVWIVLLGLIAGGCGGLLGIGGSIVIIPGLVLLRGGQGQHLYQAVAMIVNFFIVAPAVWRHRRAAAIQGWVTRWTIPSAVVGAVGGVCLSEIPIFHGSGQGYLQIGFAAFLLYVLAYNLRRLRPGRSLATKIERPVRASRLSIVGLVGLPAGVMSGLLGIGGGLYTVPAQQVWLGIRLQNAIANSAATILVSSVVGAAVKNAALGRHGFAFSESLLLAAILIPSAALGSWITSAGVHRWPVRAIRVAFAILLIYSAGRMASTGWQQVNPPVAVSEWSCFDQKQSDGTNPW